MEHRRQLYTTTVLLLLLHVVSAKSIKVNTRPVHEVINEQSRIEEKRVSSPQGTLPYGNPLAGNSKQNARLHAQNQQAMFNAEKVRQHRAQLQRWTKAPQQMDSYMKAYQESQESHQLALEKQQAIRGDKTDAPSTKTPQTRLIKNHKEDTSKISRPLKRGPAPDSAKITRSDAVLKDKNRNHRSYGSVDNRYLQPNRYQSVYLSPGPTYDQGVTIKPNGNVGLTQIQSENESSKLYTQAIASTTKHVNPKQYNQMQNYQSAQDIENLNALLNKKPNDQLSQLNALITATKPQDNKDVLNTPIDLYFYLKDPPMKSLTQYYKHAKYAQLPQNYANAYTPATEIKAFTPITEELDDIDDPNKNIKLKSYGIQTVLASNEPETDTTTTDTRSNNYYKVDVASETVVANHAPNEDEKYYSNTNENEKPTYQAFQSHETPTEYAQEEVQTKGDVSERYLHHNAEFRGIQHLNEDGTGVSAYGDDNLHYAANYEFGYRVRDHHSGNDFGHYEAKNEGKTRGHYHVLLPDGRLQKVRYSAGPEGFHADISYDHLNYKH